MEGEGLRWASSGLFGGSGGEVLWDIAVGPDDSVYVVGQTNSADFPIARAFQDEYGGNGDAFIARFAPDRQTLLYSTFLGGTGLDVAGGIAVGPEGDAYVVGLTESADFPQGTISTLHRGTGYDLFVVKLAPDGSKLGFATILGGGGAEGAEDVALAGDGSLYVVGHTSSPDLPVRTAFQNALHGVVDGFILRLDGESGSPISLSYLGGDGIDDVRALAIARDGSVYFAGNTDSRDLPVVGNEFRGGLRDCFIGRIGNDGRTLDATAYLGGSSEDRLGPGGLSVTPQGDLVLAAWTSSADFPMVNGPRPVFSDGWFDGVVALIDPMTFNLRFSTYVGGSDVDAATRAISDGRRIYVTGETASRDFPIRCARQAEHGDARYDAFIVAIEIAPPRLELSTYVGGGSGRGLAWTSSGELLVSGESIGLDFPQVGPWPFSSGGEGDGMLITLVPADAACPGDCCADGRVTVDELVTGVGIALGSRLLGDCRSLDTDGDGQVSVSELITAVRAGLGTCGSEAG